MNTPQILFMGDSFAANHLRQAAINKGLTVVRFPEEAHLVFISQDAGISEDGTRDLTQVMKDIQTARSFKAVKVLTSQVPPGFTRALNMDIYHQAETLRIKDARERAAHPEYICVGCNDPRETLPQVYLTYLRAFNCPIIQCSYEEAEFSKIAVNMTLASQVENANRLSEVAKKIPHVKWGTIAQILYHDRRIGQYSYLKPGDWRKSPHLLRDWVTLQDIKSGN
jgi:UDP-glucose 6-dehydrogenase